MHPFCPKINIVAMHVAKLCMCAYLLVNTHQCMVVLVLFCFFGTADALHIFLSCDGL